MTEGEMKEGEMGFCRSLVFLHLLVSLLLVMSDEWVITTT
jgi:hypothetical protein